MSDFAQLILMWIWLCVIRKLADANIPICYLHEFDVKVKAMQFCIKLSILLAKVNLFFFYLYENMKKKQKARTMPSPKEVYV